MDALGRFWSELTEISQIKKKHVLDLTTHLAKNKRNPSTILVETCIEEGEGGGV